MRVRVIVNPKAGSGSAARRLPAILNELTRAGARAEAVETLRPGDATRLVREAGADGVDCVALVGGDGTLNEAVQAFIDADGTPRGGPVLGVVPSGTGGDFRKTFGLGTTVEEAVARLMTSPPRPLDLGVVEATGHDGGRVVRAFVNIMSFGIGGLTDKIVNASPKWLGGKAAFFLGTLRAMAVYDNAPVAVRVDGEVCVEGPILNVAVANCRYFGGGMKIAPDADPSDGLLDVVALYDLTRAQGIALARHVYKGSHPGQPGVRVARGREIVAEPLSARSEVLIDLDGETPGRLPLSARVVPAALSIRI